MANGSYSEVYWSNNLGARVGHFGEESLRKGVLLKWSGGWLTLHIAGIPSLGTSLTGAWLVIGGHAREDNSQTVDQTTSVMLASLNNVYFVQYDARVSFMILFEYNKNEEVDTWE